MRKQYLLVLLCVAILMAVILFALSTTYYTQYQCSSPVAQDKSVCAASNIEISSLAVNGSKVGYTERFFDATDASGKLIIYYNDTEIVCKEGTSESTIEKCRIGATASADTWIEVSFDGKDCFVESVKGEEDSNFCGCGINCNPYAPKETSGTIMQVLLVIDIFFIIVLVVLLVKSTREKRG